MKDSQFYSYSHAFSEGDYNGEAAYNVGYISGEVL